MQIFKYELPIVTDVITVPMPKNARVITVQNQRGVVTLWAEVDADEPRVNRVFRIIGTGHSFDRTGLRHAGTVQVGALVWHIYEYAADSSSWNVSATPPPVGEP